MGLKSDSIEIRLPFKAEYVSVVRLTASGIANRMGFDIEAIEDIKVAISEVCNKLVCCGGEREGVYRVIFTLEGERLVIVFDSEDNGLQCIFDEDEDALGISIIKALMDEVELCKSGKYLFFMSRTVEQQFKG